MRRYAAAIGLAILIGSPALIAQQQQVTDLKGVLYRMGGGGGGFKNPVGLGLHRGVQDEDSVLTVEYWGTGTMRAIGPKIGPVVQLKSMYVQFAYDFPGMRVDMTRADGTREIQVVSGTYAWNEIDKIGGGLEPGWGSAVPAMDAVPERLLRMWTSPMGVYKAAFAAQANAKTAVENGAVTLTFPLSNGKPGNTSNLVVGALEGIPVKVTLNARYQPARVEVRYNNRLYVSTYTEYGDLNDADYQSDIFTPRRVVRTVDGETVLDLTIQRTNTYNPYVLMPVPESVRKAAGR